MQGQMSFDQRFQFTGAVPASVGALDYAIAGRQIADGRPVTVHLLAGGRSPENDRLLQSIASLPPEYKVCFLDSGDFQGTMYVVTDVLAGNPPLREWVAALARKRAEEKAANPDDLTRVRAWKIPVWAAGGKPVPDREADT